MLEGLRLATRLRRDLCETTRRAKGAQKVAAERKHGDAALVVLTHKQLLARAGERPARKHLCSRLDSSPSVRASKQVRPRSRDSTREAALAVRAQVTCAKDWGVATGYLHGGARLSRRQRRERGRFACRRRTRAARRLPRPPLPARGSAGTRARVGWSRRAPPLSGVESGERRGCSPARSFFGEW